MMQFGPHPALQPDGTFAEVDGTYFKPGDLPDGWQKVGVLNSDEPNLAPEAIVQAYRSMNDSSRELVVYHHRFRRHDYCFPIMAMNPDYDFRNIGAKPLAGADARRLVFHWMTHPSDDQIRAIILRNVKQLNSLHDAKTDDDIVPTSVMNVIIESHKDLVQLSVDGKLPSFWTVSQDVKVARLVPDFGLVGAYMRAYFNYIDPKLAAVPLGLIRGHIPYGSPWA
jgi:hypothetical protein